MNLLLLDSGCESAAIPREDRRYSHILEILKKKRGERIEAGSQDGRIGEALIREVSDTAILLDFRARGEAPPLHPVGMILGFPRPIQAQRIVKDLTSLGLASIWFALTELGEKSYAESSFFREEGWIPFVREGAEQSGNPRLPEIRCFWSVRRALDALKADSDSGKAGSKVCFHPGPGIGSFGSSAGFAAPACLALGSERGWTEAETRLFQAEGFTLASLGTRILKTETAASAAAAIALARLGLI